MGFCFAAFSSAIMELLKGLEPATDFLPKKARCATFFGDPVFWINRSLGPQNTSERKIGTPSGADFALWSFWPDLNRRPIDYEAPKIFEWNHILCSILKFNLYFVSKHCSKIFDISKTFVFSSYSLWWFGGFGIFLVYDLAGKISLSIKPTINQNCSFHHSLLSLKKNKLLGSGTPV